jgi:iron(II)-dependent oxidoreductase
MTRLHDHTLTGDRHQLIEWYTRNRARSTALFELLAGDQAYYSQPISLRHPLVFYEGHLPAFSFNTVMKKALGAASIDPALEVLFARGIDPESAEVETSDPDRNRERWPDRRTVQAFAKEVDRRLKDALLHADLDRPGHPLLERAEAVFAILEHEAMHQETLLYLWHQLPLDQKRRPHGYEPRVDGADPHQAWIAIPGGAATLGVARSDVPFAWDNESGPYVVQTESFEIERHNVTNAAFMEFVLAGGYSTRTYWTDDDWQWIQAEQIRHPHFWVQRESDWFWRGMFDRLPLPQSWPVYVSHAEASAYARWRGARLPTEAEFNRAAFGSPEGERYHPWGDASPTPAHGVFDFASWDPEPAGSHPEGRSAWGVDDLVGNGWEWTATPFAPFPGFEPRPCYPEYSADFFDQQHFVMKGASPATARELIRPTFRNWFRPRYPYVYATFRCARSVVR